MAKIIREEEQRQNEFQKMFSELVESYDKTNKLNLARIEAEKEWRQSHDNNTILMKRFYEACWKYWGEKANKMHLMSLDTRKFLINCRLVDAVYIEEVFED